MNAKPNRDCPQCSRPIAPETAVYLGDVIRVRFCHENCRARWISSHDRRHHTVWVEFERRVAS
jgi:hypothetical protein